MTTEMRLYIRTAPKENVIPCRAILPPRPGHLAGIRKQVQTTGIKRGCEGIKHAFQQDQDSNVDGKRMVMMYQESPAVPSAMCAIATLHQQQYVDVTAEDGINARV
jgi:hypothetical protein